MRIIYILLFIAVVCSAALFRFTGINWDDNTHLQPDERFLTMVTNDISWPNSLAQYFDTHTSPLNPHNKNYSFYVYGTYPMYVTKVIAEFLHMDNYNGITIVGRTISALMDIVTLLAVFLIAKYLAHRYSNDHPSTRAIIPLMAAFCYAVSVIPIQLSHFFTVDPYVTAFCTIALWKIIRGKINLSLGIIVAFAVGAKISAVLIIPIIGCAFLMAFPWHGNTQTIWMKRRDMILHGLLCAVGFLITLRGIYPYLFDGWHLNQLVLANWQQLASFDSPTTSFPPGIQWLNVSLIQPTLDLIVWGLGIPLGIVAITSIIYFIHNISTIGPKRNKEIILILLWVILVLDYQSFQFAKPMRYFWPIYPAIAVLSGILLSRLVRHISTAFHISHFVTLLLCLPLLLWPLAFIHIYMAPTTRVTATNWIYANIPAHKTIAWESWDDPLPLSIGNKSPSIYDTIAMPIFDPDGNDKWTKIASALAKTDYVILSSNRGFGAMGRAKNRFPQTFAYYQRLFEGTLGFTLRMVFTSRPLLPITGIHTCVRIPGFSYGYIASPRIPCTTDGIAFVDDGADETFTVYDHPTVFIFEKIHQLPDYKLILQAPHE